jgi:hypothetical protein
MRVSADVVDDTCAVPAPSSPAQPAASASAAIHSETHLAVVEDIPPNSHGSPGQMASAT